MKNLYTTAIRVVAGIMREAVLQFALSNGILIEEKPLEIKELEVADEFLTNVLHGIVSVSEFNKKSWATKQAAF